MNDSTRLQMLNQMGEIAVDAAAKLAEESKAESIDLERVKALAFTASAAHDAAAILVAVREFENDWLC